MELVITKFFNEAAPRDYAASVAEIGANAGADTWAAACEDAPDYNILDTEEKREAYRQHIRGYGAWNAAEIAAMNDTELNALLMQDISWEIREAGLDTGTTWEQYWSDSEAGQVQGRIFEANGEVYFTVGY